MLSNFVWVKFSMFVMILCMFTRLLDVSMLQAIGGECYSHTLYCLSDVLHACCKHHLPVASTALHASLSARSFPTPLATAQDKACFLKLLLRSAVSLAIFFVRFVCWLLACLMSQQHASASQGWICSDNVTCCHTEIEVADQTFHLTQSQYTDTGPTCRSTDPITPCARQGIHWSANFKFTGMTQPRKNPDASRI